MKAIVTCSALLAPLFFVIACASSTSAGTPEATARTMYQAIADWDTAKIASLSCEGARTDVESGLSLGSALFGLGSTLGLGTPKGELKDMQYRVVSKAPASATVTVDGRILYGAPYGSFEIGNQSVELAKEGDHWCVQK